MDFETTWNNLRPDIERSAIGLACNREDAEDLVQEVVIGMLKAGPVDNKLSFRRLAFTILGRRYIDMLRERYKRRNLVSLSDVDAENLGAYDFETILLESGIDGLPEERREAVILHGMGFTYDEIADIMDRPMTTIRHWVAGSKRVLRDM